VDCPIEMSEKDVKEVTDWQWGNRIRGEKSLPVFTCVYLCLPVFTAICISGETIVHLVLSHTWVGMFLVCMFTFTKSCSRCKKIDWIETISHFSKWITMCLKTNISFIIEQPRLWNICHPPRSEIDVAIYVNVWKIFHHKKYNW
jgi:hypothetical protein